MQKYIKKERNNRLIVLKSENVQLILKSINRNTNLINICRWETALKINNLLRKSCKVRLVHRCILTGRKNKCTNLYKFSRLTFLKLVNNSSISGLKKSIW